jgi:DNA-binding response OmpR family regulator
VFYGKLIAFYTARNVKLETEVIRRKRILLVEDERAVREALRLLLSKDAYTVVEANNGAEAFALFLGTHFDLVLTDWEMPFLKGNELAVKIKQVAPRQPILMLTAYDNKPGRDNPVDAVMKKPFDSARLRETMARLFSRSGEHPVNFARAQSNRIGSASENDTIWAHSEFR